MIPASRLSFVLLTFNLLSLLLPATVRATVQHYVVNGAESQVSFAAHSTGHDFRGETSQLSGYFGYDRERIADSAYGEIHVAVRGLRTGVSARDRNMYSHFDADHYPEMVFRLKHLFAVQPVKTDTFTVQLTGELSIKGTTKEIPVTLSAVFASDGKIVISGNTSLRMTDFGIEPPRFFFFQVAEEVQITFRVVGKAREPRL